MSLTGEDLLFAGVVVAILAAVFVARRFSDTPFPLRQWAEEQDCKIVRAIYREFAKGPFEPRRSRIGQDVYQIWIRTSEGRERRAWVLCDFSGAREPVVVAWDD